MSDAEELLRRAAQWQAERRKLSWTEKVRLIEQLLPDIRALRAARVPPRNAGSENPDPKR